MHIAVCVQEQGCREANANWTALLETTKICSIFDIEVASEFLSAQNLLQNNLWFNIQVQGLNYTEGGVISVSHE